MREAVEDDLEAFYEHQADPVASRMAAFPARGRSEFESHWRKILADKAVFKRTILVGEQVAGYVVCFEQAEKKLVGYWLGRSFWGKGVATRALSEFLGLVELRPLHALVAESNLGSIRVLEKCGFVLSKGVPASGEPPGASGDAVGERLYELTAAPPSRKGKMR